MIEIERYKNGNNYDCYNIKTNEVTFSIHFEGNLDLYWSYKYNGSILKESESHSFKITKENYFLYQLIDELYNDIKNNNIFSENFSSYSLVDSSKNGLFVNDTITWYSDECIYEEASKLFIKKDNEDYEITFYKSKEEFISYSVRISNSGSRYGHFNIPFMKMYNKLNEYDPNYHQIHMEEYLYKEKIKKLK